MPVTVLFRALYDVVLIETVGVGQSETEIADLADWVVFCAQPGSGDSLQFMKAGVVEIPDLAVVCKADMDDAARRAVADLKGALSLAVRKGAPPEVLAVSARTGAGIDDLAARLGRPSAPDAARRQAQGAAWIRATLVARFGREGLASLGDAADRVPGDSPFARVRIASTILRGRLSVK